MINSKDLCSAIGEAILKNQSIVDEHGNYKLINERVRMASGYTLEEFLGSNLQKFIHEEDFSNMFEQLKEIKPGGATIIGPYRVLAKSGMCRWIESFVTNLTKNEAVQGYLINSKDVTDAVEQALLRDKITTSYANFFAKHPFGVVHMTMDGKVDMINPQINKDLGYELDSIKGNQPINFFLPEYQRRAFYMFHKARKYGEPETCNAIVHTVDGSVLHVNLTIVPVVHKGETIEIYGVIKNISENQRLQENLKRTSIVADKTNNGVVIADNRGMVQWVNNGFTQMNGYALDEVMGKHTTTLLKSNITPDQLQQIKIKLDQGASTTNEFLCVKKDGSTYWNLVELTPVLNSNNQLEQVIAIHTDITERKKAEQELKLFAQDLYKRNKELQQFGYIVSHNLRSPVANIMGIANILEMDMESIDTVEMCTRNLQTAVQSLDTVIRDLSTILSSVDSSVDLAREPVDLTEVLNNVKEDMKEIIFQSEAEVCTPVTSQFVNSSKAYIYSIFYNLISNAIKYRSNRKPEIYITIVNHPEQMEIKIADNGIGIDMSRHKEDIFKPYKRFNAGIEGKGLGLFLVKSHIESLNGKIYIESEPGRGTTFIIQLPLNTRVEFTALESKAENIL